MSSFSIGSLNSRNSFTNTVSSANSNDIYSSSLNTAGSLKLLPNGLTADVNLGLLDSTGMVLRSSSSSDTTSETINIDGLSADNYSARVVQVSGDTHYNFRLAPDYAGNLLSTARNISVNSTTQTLSDFVGSEDTNDYYRFSLSDRNTVNLLLNGLSADADLQLLNSNGIAIEKTTSGGSTAESIIRTLEAGTYYIRVVPYGGANTNYNLNVSAEPVLQWTQQLGTSESDNSSGIAVDSFGNVYTTGTTNGSLAAPNAGAGDAWLSKHDSSGNLLWVKQLGTSNSDFSNAVAVDSAGNVYITGDTSGALAGTNAGSNDAWLAKYDTNGNQLWIRQLGTSNYDFTYDVAVDRFGNVYITGDTRGALAGTNSDADIDAWVAKYNSSGTQLWIQQLTTFKDDSAYSIAVDNRENVYITGDTETSAGDWNGWVAKYNSSGTLQWSREIGTSEDDDAYRVAVDRNGNVYVAGNTEGSLGGTNAGDDDVWVAKYTSNGTQLWIRQFGTSEYDDLYGGLTVDSTGNVYLAGYTEGSFNGANASNGDGWLAQYSSSGTQLWTQQFGTAEYDYVYDMTIDRFDNIYVTGETRGAFTGFNAGNDDAWIFAKFNRDTGGNTQTTATNLGTLSGSRTFSDFLDAVDPDDYYQFTLDTDSNFSLTLSGLVADADIQLFDSNGVAIASSTNPFANDEFLEAMLSAGTYYIRLYCNDNGNTTYTLNLAA